MKAILICGYHYNETVDIVDVKETDKSYMIQGMRFSKSSGQNGMLGYISSSKYDGPKKLYPISSEYAQGVLKKKLHKNLCKKIEKYFSDSSKVTYDDAVFVAKILKIT